MNYDLKHLEAMQIVTVTETEDHDLVLEFQVDPKFKPGDKIKLPTAGIYKQGYEAKSASFRKFLKHFGPEMEKKGKYITINKEGKVVTVPLPVRTVPAFGEQESNAA